MSIPFLNTRENIGLLFDERGHLINRDADKAETFKAFFAFVFNAEEGLWHPRCPELEDYGNDQFPANLNSCGICCFIWMHISPWRFIHWDSSQSTWRASWCHCENCLNYFSMILGIWRDSRWLEADKHCSNSQDSARKKTLVITGLSVSLQCLVKLWRKLCWEFMKNTWRTMRSLVTAYAGSWGEGPI